MNDWYSCATCHDDEFRVPLLRTINPFLWEIGTSHTFKNIGCFATLQGAADARRWRPFIRLGERRSRQSLESAFAVSPSYGRISEATRDRVLDLLAGSTLSSKDESLYCCCLFHEECTTRRSLSLVKRLDIRPTFAVGLAQGTIPVQRAASRKAACPWRIRT